MHKIKLIIAREFLTRVKKKSFIIMTILGPILFGAVAIMPALIQKLSEKETYKIILIDEAPKIFQTHLLSNAGLHFINDTLSIKEAKLKFSKYEADAILYIPADYIKNSHLIRLISEKQLGIEVKSTIEEVLSHEIEVTKIKALGLTQEQVETTKTELSIKTQRTSYFCRLFYRRPNILFHFLLWYASYAWCY